VAAFVSQWGFIEKRVLLLAASMLKQEELAFFEDISAIRQF
jgi:hypothetical protein